MAWLCCSVFDFLFLRDVMQCEVDVELFLVGVWSFLFLEKAKMYFGTFFTIVLGLSHAEQMHHITLRYVLGILVLFVPRPFLFTEL